MRIKKVSGTAVLNGNVVDNLTDNSTENAPSQRAVNEALLDKYSTEEQRIGTWFGKPLYRKSFYFDTVSSSNVDIGILPTNIKDISGRFLNDGYFNKINQYTTDQNYRFNIDVSPTGIMRIQKGTSVTATDVYIDIEYAKKTD